MTNHDSLRLSATPTIELAAAFTPSALAGGPKISRYLVTAPIATEPRAIRRAGVVPAAAELTEYLDGVYVFTEYLGVIAR